MSDAKDIRVGIEEAKALLDEGYSYIDVRTEAEYAAGHAVGAANVPVMLRGPGGMKPNDQFVAVMEASFDKDHKLVIGCQSGGRSRRAASALIAAGYENVVDMCAGYGGKRNAFGQATEKGWSAAGMPTELTTEGRSYAELLAKVG